jgi:meso-butanediol dehydrogenase / (S,S)-butanediol dehydrogenase / diacetyl reductase
MKMKDQVVIVTGGGGGIGEGICLCMAREGANVVVSDYDLTIAEGVAEKVEKAGQKALAVQTDVRKADDCRHLVEKTIDTMGKLDVMVCNAGVDGLPLDDTKEPHLIENIREESWDHVMDVNLKGIFQCCKVCVPYFKEKKTGKIINIASVAGRQGVDTLLPYAASKAGVISFTQSLAIQLAPYHINVNTVCPGIIWTPMWKRLTMHLGTVSELFAEASSEEIFDAAVQQAIPFGKPQTAEDIGNSVVFFASKDAEEITGQALNVCGGMRMN